MIKSLKKIFLIDGGRSISYDMINLCFYISDYGYGHASRDIAIIRDLVKRYGHFKIYVRTGKPYDSVKRSLGDNIITIPRENDAGIILQKDNFLVDIRQTKKLVENWANSLDVYIQEEKILQKE